MSDISNVGVTNVGPTLNRCSKMMIRRWPNVNPTVGSTIPRWATLHWPNVECQRWSNITDVIGPTLGQRTLAIWDKTLICFTAFSPLKSNAFYFNLRNYFAIAYLSLSVYINIQFVGVNWFTENSERDWLMSSIGTFWLANALGERRAIAERHSTEVECLKKGYSTYCTSLISECTWKS